MARRPARKRNPKRVYEVDIHTQVAEFLRYAWPADLPWYHVPNEGYRSPRTGAKLARMGMTRGIADLTFHLPGGRVAYIELKARDGKLSDDQIAFREACIRHGHGYAVARTLDEVEPILVRWLAKFGLALQARIGSAA